MTNKDKGAEPPYFPPPRDFKGIWIPREIWLHPELLPLEKMVWAEIHSLYDRTRGGCYASNQYLSNFFGVGETYISKLITKLKKLGLIQEVTFNGRTRVIRAILPPEDFSECKADLHYSARQTNTPVQPRVAPQCNPPIYIENKEDNKEEREGASAPKPPARSSVDSFSKKKKAAEESGPPKKAYRENVHLTDDEYSKLVKANSQSIVDAMLDKLNSYKLSHGKVYKSDYATMTKGGWVYKEIVEKQGTNNANNTRKGPNRADEIQQRQLSDYRKANGEFGSNNTLDFSQTS